MNLVCAVCLPFLSFVPLTTFFVYPPPHPAAGAPRPPGGINVFGDGSAPYGGAQGGRGGVSLVFPFFFRFCNF